MLQLILTQKHNNLFLKCNKLECQVYVSTFKFISQGCTQAVPGGLWRLTFALGQLENLTFFITNHMLGTLDFTSSEHWAPFNFSQSTAL